MVQIPIIMKIKQFFGTLFRPIVVFNCLGMILISLLLGIGAYLGIFIPRQVYHGLQEAYLYGVVWTLRMDGVQLGKFLLEYLLRMSL